MSGGSGLFADGVGGNSPVNQGRFANTADDRFRILEKYRRIAMVGLSSNPFRPSHFAAIYLTAEGYDVIPVNPRESQILGRRSYPSLAAIPGPVEVVDIFLRGFGGARNCVRGHRRGSQGCLDAVGSNPRSGGGTGSAQAGLEVVMDRCMKIEHARFWGGLNTIGLNTAVISSKRRK